MSCDTVREDGMLRQSVIFVLQHAHGSMQEKASLSEAMVLTDIQGVEKFEQLKQVSKKNDYEFGFSMEFKDQAAYDAYNDHPTHVKFVRERWAREGRWRGLPRFVGS